MENSQRKGRKIRDGGSRAASARFIPVHTYYGVVNMQAGESRRGEKEQEEREKERRFGNLFSRRAVIRDIHPGNRRRTRNRVLESRQL